MYFSTLTGSALATAWNPVCLGTVDGVIGKIKVHPGLYTIGVLIYSLSFIYIVQCTLLSAATSHVFHVTDTH